MSRAALVLRPAPGDAATAGRLAAIGMTTIRQPLFAVRPVAWTPPGASGFDALMLTSANAVRHAGPGLAGLRDLPVVAVGRATAAAAAAVGFTVALTGCSDAAALAAAARACNPTRLLHLAGRDHIAIPGVTSVAVYASDPLPVPAGAARSWEGQVALLHSERAARRFAALVDRDRANRGRIVLAAISPAVRDAAGTGWAVAFAADEPTDTALVTLAARLIDPSARARDKPCR
ncbi:uroporphyrinogen-III synthase [uncultured Sphingomonas sp.]|uniref:uroporphyrinogen-III synthase n=1 Tax=uncultured Sphingomonas sp. TaxID=158754 RepID=UPI0035CBC6AC